MIGLKNSLTFNSVRAISSKATYQKDNDKVKLRGKFIKGTQPDLPHFLWISDLVEPAENFVPFFTRPDNKIKDIRNIWLINPRNFGDSDHHDSFSLEDISNDIVRFMDEHRITLAGIGGHGYGAKVATATAINHMNRFTGVVCLEGGPLDQRYYESYQELVSYIEFARNLNLEKLSPTEVFKKLGEGIADPKWRHIFMQNVVTDKGHL